MRAKKGYKKQKPNSPEIGKWLKKYFKKRTCRKIKVYLKKYKGE